MRRMMLALMGLFAVTVQAQQPVTPDQRRLYTECVGSMERGSRQAFMQSMGFDQDGLDQVLRLTDICIREAHLHPLSPALMQRFESLVDTYRSSISVPSNAAVDEEVLKADAFLRALN